MFLKLCLLTEYFKSLKLNNKKKLLNFTFKTFLKDNFDYLNNFAKDAHTNLRY